MFDSTSKLAKPALTVTWIFEFLLTTNSCFSIVLNIFSIAVNAPDFDVLVNRTTNSSPPYRQNISRPNINALIIWAT